MVVLLLLFVHMLVKMLCLLYSVYIYIWYTQIHLQATLSGSPVQLLVNSNSWSANCMAAAQCIRHVEVVMTPFWRNGCWCQTGWSEYVRNSWSAGIYTHNHLWVYRERSEKEKISSENALLVWEVRGEWADWFQMIGRQQELKWALVPTEECRTPSLNAQHVEPWRRWAAAAEEHTGSRSCQLTTGNWDYSSHRLTRTGQ